MKSAMTAIAILALAAPVWAGASPGTEQRRYTVTDFDRVQVEGPFEVVLQTGKAPSARAIGSRAAIERVSITVEGRTLKVRPDSSGWGGYPGEGQGPVAIALSGHRLRAASVTGSGSLAIDHAKAMRLDLALSGSGRLSLAKLEADSLVIGQIGAGRMILGGHAKELKATVQGSGDFDGRALSVDGAQLRADTSGTVALVANRTAAIVSSGTGETEVAGQASCTVKALGSGRVRCGG